MIKISYEDIVNKIKDEKGLSETEIEGKIKKKVEQLAGLISKDGAAHIIANELGVKVFKEGAIKVSEILSGMREVEINAKVLTVFGVVSFKKEEREGKVASFLVGDESGKIRTVLWDNNHISYVENGQLKEGSIVKIKNAYVKDNNEFKELHLGSRSELILSPEGVVIDKVDQSPVFFTSSVKKVSELNGGDGNVVIRGTVVQIFEPRFYEMCSECNKKVVLEDGQYKCSVHGSVNHRYGVIGNFILDDGSDSIRVATFRELVEKLFGVSNEEVMAMRTDPGKFEAVKDNILGKLVEIQGRVNKNLFFDRLDINANSIEELKAENLIKEMEG